jgi:hypothetical protein
LIRKKWQLMDYTLDDLKAELAATEPGEETCVAYGQYALLFPPGEPIKVRVSRRRHLRRPTAAPSATGQTTILFAS